MAWQQIGYMMIIYIAGLQAVPEDILEAARIDGASSWQTLWKVTIPNVMPSITICTFLTLTNSFKLFDQNLALTAGRPFVQAGGETLKTTEMLALNIYNAFYASSTNRGMGSGQGRRVLHTRERHKHSPAQIQQRQGRFSSNGKDKYTPSTANPTAARPR